MKKIFIISFICSAFCLFGLEYSKALSKIPEIANDQSKIVDILWSLDKKDREPFIKEVEKAFKAYPTSEIERTNMFVRLKYYCYMSTNNVPTTVLVTDWHNQIKYKQLMELKNISVKTSNNDMNLYGMDNVNIMTLPDEINHVSKEFINKKPIKQKNENVGPYRGQSLKAY